MTIKFSQSSIMIIATLLLSTLIFTLTNGVIYNIIAEPIGVSTNFPIKDFAEFEFSYATPDPFPISPDPDNLEQYRSVLIIVDLKDTNLTLDSCYVGSGNVGANEIYTIDNRWSVLRTPVQQEAFYQATCRYNTPTLEQDPKEIKVFIYEIPLQSLHDKLQELTDITLTVDSPLSQVIKYILPDTQTWDKIENFADSNTELTVPAIFTEETVFSFHYIFEPDGRMLLNETEIDAVRQIHYSFIDSRVRIPSVDSVLVADHYVTRDYTKRPSEVYEIHLLLYTLGTSSQFDFRLGLDRHVKPVLEELQNPLYLKSLVYDVSWVYRSNCYNKIQDFNETYIDCGNPILSSCGHCTSSESSCSTNSDCSSDQCADNNKCVYELGQFIPRSSAYVGQIVIAIVLVAVSMIALL